MLSWNHQIFFHLRDESVIQTVANESSVDLLLVVDASAASLKTESFKIICEVLQTTSIAVRLCSS